jgi:hypothetical protein
MHAHQIKIEANDGGLSRKIEANQEEVETKMVGCLEEMKVETIRAPEDRSGDQRPAMVYRNPRKRRTKDYVVQVTFKEPKF